MGCQQGEPVLGWDVHVVWQMGDCWDVPSELLGLCVA